MPELTIKDVEKVFDKGFEKQALMINNAFQEQKGHIDKQLVAQTAHIEEQIDNLRTDFQRIETKVDKALHVEYVNLEVRVKPHRK